MRNDLTNATFIVPIRIESQDRLRNVLTVLYFLLSNFDTNIIVKEVDTKSVFNTEVLPLLEDADGIELDKLTHIFEKSDDPVFYRMHILNDMLSKSKTKVVINYDCDVLLPIESYVTAYNSILSDQCDLIYPFGQGVYQYQVNATDELVNEFIDSEFDFDTLVNVSNKSTSDFGWVQFFNRESYIKGGMENENFRGSSPEDKERFFRFTTLGYKVGRLNNWIYHLEHSRGNNSWPVSVKGNPYMQDNLNLWAKLQTMDKGQLLKYYSNQEYLQKYK